MKANRKFVEGKEAVSVVACFILMVAIAVVIAPTVYVSVTRMLYQAVENSYWVFDGYFESMKVVDTYDLYIVVDDNPIFLTQFEYSYMVEDYMMMFLGHNVSLEVKCLSYDFPNPPEYRLLDIDILN